jgi:hypothetical protein
MRRPFQALTIGFAVVAVLALVLVPMLPYNPNMSYGPCCSGVSGQSITFKYLGYGFLSFWSSSTVSVESTNHYYEWCHNTGGGFSCRNGFSLG